MGEIKKGDDCTFFFLGYGTLLSTPNVVIKAETPADVLLEFKKGHGTTLHRLIALSVFKKKTYKLKANTEEKTLK